jgi:3'-phosphoadenosine 5'-phosphosulfate sulfotransferase (PAPS reductase)/FAD synthetase
MKDKIPQMEYVFCDTEKELPETYEYLDKLEVFLSIHIVRLKHDGMGFDDLLQIRNGYLPSAQVRWCTEYLKIKPYEKYVGDDPIVSYIGIRADEPYRKGYISTKSNMRARFPFIENRLVHADIIRILNNSGLGLPQYYKWRSRSGCFFCFFQQRREWIGLLENHPELYEDAKRYEKRDPVTGESYTWVQNESLEELARPERIAQIKADYARRCEREAAFRADAALTEVFGSDPASLGKGCLICHL